ncbi:probable glycosyltransferase At5g03795 [Rhodamnia argentea]|uniref:Probable glycosyltransferase At5g03795 n=1 Tax=Rhodamnia argentea TaxID=178133 RepID=A0ABM3HSV5_9MYRT|nr:probable glycosyltransferase At5g03795 [Rhodamnia argentea]
MLVADPSFLLLLSLLTPLSVHFTPPPPPPPPRYLSPPIFAADYDDMLANFGIFVYDARRTYKIKSEAETLFLASLLGSPFFTEKPSEARRAPGVREARRDQGPLPGPPVSRRSGLPDRVRAVGSETFERRLAMSEFCLFDYGGDVSGIRDAMRLGCVVGVITDRPIQDLPLIDVLRWQEMAVAGGGGGAEGVKRALREMTREHVERMRGSCVAASRHFAWNQSPQLLDAFHMVVYQLWLRRHSIRDARREWS